MKHIAGWFRRNRLLMAQAVDLQRQLQEAWGGNDRWVQAYGDEVSRCSGLRDQLHRVARERDKERSLRLAAEELRDYYIENEEAYLGSVESASVEPFAMTPEEIHDKYLEQLENEEE